jgi:hypothetical protein
VYVRPFPGPGGKTQILRFVALAGSRREPEPVTSVHIVQNWFEELKRLVPTR